MNILQTLFQSVTSPPIPLHEGEAFGLWTYYEAVAQTRSHLLILLNHTDDEELKELMEHFIADVLEPQIGQVKGKLLHEGISLPNVSRDRPKADPSQIPPGARFSNDDIAQVLVARVQGLLSLCQAGLNQSLRDEVGQMFYNFQNHVLLQGVSLKGMMRKRRWLRVPPPHAHTRAPAHSRVPDTPGR